VEQQTEVERKYDVAADVALPDLTGVPGVAVVADPVELEQVATYVDTPRLRLLTAGVTVRRRVGGVDDGWHLKLPAGADRREELRWPAGEAPGGAPGEVPPALRERLGALVAGQPLAPVAVLTTRRSVRRLLDADGRVLAELCDDRVSARTLASSDPGAAGESLSWREWEVELVEGAAELLDQVGGALGAVGATRSASDSKVARALGGRPGAVRSAGLGPESTTGDVLLTYLDTQRGRLMRNQLSLVTGDEEAVHQLRVASRRLRSALVTYRPVLAPEVADRLVAELRWLGGSLGEARDAQVLRLRLDDLVAAQPDGPDLGTAARRLDDELVGREAAGRRTAHEVLAGERYRRLLDDLEQLVCEPPFTSYAASPGRQLVPELVAADLRRVRRRHRAWLLSLQAVEQGAGDPAAAEAALHGVRKAAKRLRYAAESAVPVAGKRAADLAVRAEALQDLLGEHQDTVVARALVRESGDRAHRAGEPGQGFERLDDLEAARAAELVSAYPDALADLPSGRLRSWVTD
jgi:CHAD domain-containing protein